MGKSTKKSASKAGAAPTKSSNEGKRGAEDLINNDNRKKRKKNLVQENGNGAKTTKTVIELKPSGTLFPVESNSKASKDASGEESSEKDEPSKMLEVEKSVIVLKENNSSEEISSEEDIVASSEEAEVTGCNFPKTQDEMAVTSKEQPAGSKTLFVGNLSFSVEQADVENFFKAAGEIVRVRLAMGSDSSFRGIGYVEFTTAEAAAKALNELNGKDLVERPVRLELAKERGSDTPNNGEKEKGVQSLQKGGRSSRQIISVQGFSKDCGKDQDEMAVTSKEQPAGSKTLFVGNLSFSVKQADVENFFKAAGEIVGARLAMGSDSAFRGFGHVEFTTAEAAAKALNELNGKDLVGRPVRLELAKERGSDTPNSGGKEKEVQPLQKGGRRSGHRHGGHTGRRHLSDGRRSGRGRAIPQAKIRGS